MRNISPEVYRALDDFIKDEGPWALENRAPADQGGSGNYYANRGTKILGIVFHITAGIQDYDGQDRSAEAVTNYGMTTDRDASWPMAIFAPRLSRRAVAAPAPRSEPDTL